MTPIKLALIAALVAAPALAQERLYTEMPSVEDTARLLRGARNLVDAGGASVIQPAPGATAVAVAVGKPRPTAQSRRPAAFEICKSGGGATDFSVSIQFRLNSAALETRFVDDVARLASALRQEPSARLEIGGHTDVSGGDGINTPLSRRRALTVFRTLVERFGVDPARLSVAGYAAARLCAPDRPRAAVNRRVGFRVL